MKLFPAGIFFGIAFLLVAAIFISERDFGIDEGDYLHFENTLTADLKGSIYESGEIISLFGTCKDGNGVDLNATALLSAYYPNGTLMFANTSMDRIENNYLYVAPMSVVGGTYLTKMECLYQGESALAYGEWQNPAWVARLAVIQDAVENLNLSGLTVTANNTEVLLAILELSDFTNISFQDLATDVTNIQTLMDTYFANHNATLYERIDWLANYTEVTMEAKVQWLANFTNTTIYERIAWLATYTNTTIQEQTAIMQAFNLDLDINQSLFFNQTITDQTNLVLAEIAALNFSTTVNLNASNQDVLDFLALMNQSITNNNAAQTLYLTSFMTSEITNQTTYLDYKMEVYNNQTLNLLNEINGNLTIILGTGFTEVNATIWDFRNNITALVNDLYTISIGNQGYLINITGDLTILGDYVYGNLTDLINSLNFSSSSSINYSEEFNITWDKIDQINASIITLYSIENITNYNTQVLEGIAKTIGACLDCNLTWNEYTRGVGSFWKNWHVYVKVYNEYGKDVTEVTTCNITSNLWGDDLMTLQTSEGTTYDEGDDKDNDIPKKCPVNEKYISQELVEPLCSRHYYAHRLDNLGELNYTISCEWLFQGII